jgi:biopolymer transport protein ExbD
VSSSLGGKNGEPNLVPLLDLVLQLVMFFMVCANFVMEQVNETIKLPAAYSSKPLDKAADRTVYLNVNEKGEVLLSPLDAIENKTVLSNELEVQSYMKKRYDEDVRGMKPEEVKNGPRLRVVIRADGRADTELVNKTLRACRLAGFSNAELRVMGEKPITV